MRSRVLQHDGSSFRTDWKGQNTRSRKYSGAYLTVLSPDCETLKSTVAMWSTASLNQSVKPMSHCGHRHVSVVQNAIVQLGCEPWCLERLKWTRPTHSKDHYNPSKSEAGRHDQKHTPYGASEIHHNLHRRGH